jgi:hypothetical protein
MRLGSQGQRGIRQIDAGRRRHLCVVRSRCSSATRRIRTAAITATLPLERVITLGAEEKIERGVKSLL